MQSAARQGRRQRPGKEAGNAQTESQEARRDTAASPGALGRCRWEKTLPCPPCSVLGATPSALPSLAPSSVCALVPNPWDPPRSDSSGDRGRSPPRSPSLLRHRCCLRSQAHPLIPDAPGPWPPVPGCCQAPPREGHFCCSFGTPHTTHSPAGRIARKMLVTALGAWCRPLGHAADGLPAALCSSKQPLNPAAGHPDTTKHQGVSTGLAVGARLKPAPATARLGSLQPHQHRE